MFGQISSLWLRHEFPTEGGETNSQASFDRTLTKQRSDRGKFHCLIEDLELYYILFQMYFKKSMAQFEALQQMLGTTAAT